MTGEMIEGEGEGEGERREMKGEGEEEEGGEVLRGEEKDL